MEVQVSLRREDLVAFHRTQLVRGLDLAWACGAVGVVLVLLVTLYFATDEIDPLVLGVGIVIGLVALFGASVWLRGCAAIVEEEVWQDVLDRFREGPWKITITPAGVGVAGRTFRNFHHWAHCRKLVQTEQHLFLILTPPSPTIIPKRAFASDQAFRDFAERCQAYFDDAESVARSRPAQVSQPRATGIIVTATEVTNVPPTS